MAATPDYSKNVGKLYLSYTIVSIRARARDMSEIRGIRRWSLGMQRYLSLAALIMTLDVYFSTTFRYDKLQVIYSSAKGIIILRKLLILLTSFARAEPSRAGGRVTNGRW